MHKKERAEWTPAGWMQRVYDWQERMVERFLAFLRRWVVRIPLRVVRWMVVTYLIMGGLLFTLLICDLAREDRMNARFHSITFPAAVSLHSSGGPVLGSSFQRGLDSIRSDISLGRRLDSLMRARAGFADTIRQLEELYHP